MTDGFKLFFIITVVILIAVAIYGLAKTTKLILERDLYYKKFTSCHNLLLTMFGEEIAIIEGCTKEDKSHFIICKYNNGSVKKFLLQEVFYEL